MKLLGSTEDIIDADKKSENVPKLENVEVVLVHCNLVNNAYQQPSRVLFPFVPTKQYAQIKKLIQSGGFLGKLLSKLAGPLMKVAILLGKNVLAPLGLTAAMSAFDGSIQKKIHGSGVKLIIEQEDMKDIMKIKKADIN